MNRKFEMVKQGSLPLTAKSADDIYQIAFSAPLTFAFDEVWGALVKPEKLALWLMPVAGKMAKGGVFHLGDVASGKIAVCEPKRRLSMTFLRGNSQQSLDITFSETGKGKAKARILSMKVAARKSDLPQGVWENYGPALVGIGWELAYRSLLTYLANPKTPPAKEAFSVFAASSEGRAYMTQAFAAWREAAQTGGADIAGMASAQPNLLGFYSGLHP